MNRIPKHVAIILDGNGRWAKAHHKFRAQGHVHGAFNLRDVAKYADSIGVKNLTVYCFSTENWKRPEKEVNFLMKMPPRYFEKFWDQIVTKTNIVYKVIGRRDRIPAKLLETFEHLEEATKNKTGMVLTLCVDYGSQDEIITGVKEIAEDYKNGKITLDEITPALMDDHLFTKGYPKLDLLIRTSGEYRISNYLLWQLAYSELYFTDICFPEFTPERFKEALISYQSRDRRYGGLNDNK